MNAVEIEETISALAEQRFDPVEFPFAFLQAFGNKDTTIKRLRAGASNKSDLGGVLQTNIEACHEPGSGSASIQACCPARSRRGFPGFVEPCQPALREELPRGAGRVHEIKFDGYVRRRTCETERPAIYPRRAYLRSWEKPAITRRLGSN